MLKNILGFAPKLESDGSYSPSKMALKMGVSDTTDFENISYQKYNGKKSKVLVIFTEEKNLKMKNDVVKVDKGDRRRRTPAARRLQSAVAL